MHIIKHSNDNSTLAILECANGGYLKAFCLKAFCKHLPDGKLVEVRVDPSARSWAVGVFEQELASQELTTFIQPIRWGVSLEEASEEDSQDVGLLWLALARAGLTNAFDPDAFRQGLMALEALEKAKAIYSQKMNSLGFMQYENGNYEDYATWLALPGFPLVQFPDEDYVYQI